MKILGYRDADYASFVKRLNRRALPTHDVRDLVGDIIAEVAAQGDKALAVHYLQQFLGMDPSHTDALAKLGTLLNEQAASARARTRVFLIFEQVLRRDTERQDIRREVVRLASQLGRFNDGLEHLKILMPDPAKTDDWADLKVQFSSPLPMTYGPKEPYTLTCSDSRGRLVGLAEIYVDRGKTTDVGEVCTRSARAAKESR